MARSFPAAIVLVDGYNIIGTWPTLKRSRDRQGLDVARRDLIEALASYSAFRGFETEIVFDAQYQDLMGSKESVTRHLWVSYTDYNQTADTYIEKVCARFRDDARRFHCRLIVATSDRVQRHTVSGYGAELMSAQQLLTDVEMTQRSVTRKMRLASKPTRPSLSNSIDPDARRRLAQWRFGLKPEQP